MNINFGLDINNLIIVIVQDRLNNLNNNFFFDNSDIVTKPQQSKTDNRFTVISLYDYYCHKDNLEESITSGKIKTKHLSSLDIMTIGPQIYDSLKGWWCQVLTNDSSAKTAFDLLNSFLDKGVSYITHDFPNKNQLCLSLTTGSYFINNETVSVKHIELSMGEYYQGDYAGTTSEGCHYMAYGDVYMKSTDSLNAAKLFEISKFAGPTVTFKMLNELFFNNELKFYSIEELVNM